jgi:hypothetical protein
MAVIDGEPDWKTLTQVIPEDTHELSWMYGRYEGSTTAAHSGLLDDFQYDSSSPTIEPTIEPTKEPQIQPTVAPTVVPTQYPKDDSGLLEWSYQYDWSWSTD